MLANNYNTIVNEIETQCIQMQKNENGVLLLAVSKTKSVEEIQLLYDLGVRDFGENQVQELLTKYEVLPKDIRWHMIGHLQRNKVKYIAPFIHMIHSVDSIRLAETIEKEARKNSRIIDVLVEINIAKENTKYGIMANELHDFLNAMVRFENIQCRGLMTVAPNVQNPEENRKYFKIMYDLYVDIISKKRDNNCMNVLSMGMSKDYIIAIQEGATVVRIGSNLFGNRSYIR